MDHPISQGLPGQRDAQTGQLLFLTIKRHALHIFLGHNVGHGGGRNQTPRQYRCRHGCGHDRGSGIFPLATAAGVDITDVLDDPDLGRNHFELLSNLGAHFMQGAAAGCTHLFFRRQTVFHGLHRQILKLFFTLTLFLAAAVGDFLHRWFCRRFYRTVLARTSGCACCCLTDKPSSNQRNSR